MKSNRSLSEYRHVAFDFDGTLGRLGVDWSAVRADVARAFSVDVSDVDTVRRQIREILETGGASARRVYASALQKHESIAVITRGPAVSLAMSSGGFFVISDNLHATVARGLAELDLADRCIEIVGFDDVARSKPNVDGWRLLCERHGLGMPALYVGDRERDRDFAASCGIDFLMVEDL